MNTKLDSSSALTAMSAEPRLAGNRASLKSAATRGKERPRGNNSAECRSGDIGHHSTNGLRTQPVRGIPRPSGKPLRIPAAPLAHPMLTGHPETLRSLRAAEMAAWEAVRPSTAIEPELSGIGQPVDLLRLGTGSESRSEALVLAALAICAGAAVFIGLMDLNALVASWSRIATSLKALLP